MKYWEDVELNKPQTSSESFLMTAEKIIDYASEWDPMSFHIDEELAKESPIGQLFASSVHTIAVGVKLGHAMMGEEIAIIAGLGWQDVRFPQPVFAGDELRIRSTVVEKRVSESKPERGIIVTQMELLKADDSVAVSYKIVNLVWRTPSE